MKNINTNIIMYNMNTIQTYDISHQYLSFFDIFIYINAPYYNPKPIAIIKSKIYLRHTCKSHSQFYTEHYTKYIKSKLNYYSSTFLFSITNNIQQNYLMIPNIINYNMFNLINSKYESLSFIIIKIIFEEIKISHNTNFLQTLTEWLCDRGFINIIKYTFETKYIIEEYFSANYYKAFSLSCKENLETVKYIYEIIFQNKINFEKMYSYSCLYAISNNDIQVLQYLHETIGFEIEFKYAVHNKYNYIKKDIALYLINKIGLTLKDFNHCKELHKLVQKYIQET